jgi:hypothetical protein
MIHYLRLFIVIYTGGLAVTAGFMRLGILFGGERWPAWFGGYDRQFMTFWILLWPVSLPIVLYLLFWPWGPREVDLDEESIDL